MADEGIEIPEERIGEAVVQEVIQEVLRDDDFAQVLPFVPPDMNVEPVLRLYPDQMTRMLSMIGEALNDDPEFRLAIDGLTACGDSKWQRFKEVARNVLQHDFTLENIALLYYMAGRLAIRAGRDIPRRFVEDCANLLRWILDRGRWILELDNSPFVSVFLRCTLNFLCTKLLSWLRARATRECMHVNRLSTAVQNFCERLRNDHEFQGAIDGIAQSAGGLENFNQVARGAFDQGMTWERFAVLNYVFGELALRENRWSVRNLLRWTANLFYSNRRQITDSSEPDAASVNGATSSCSLIFTFMAGIALGGFITWGATRSL